MDSHSASSGHTNHGMCLRSQARELWSHYKTIARPITVKRLSLRYINRIEVPLPLKDFNEYILINPQIATDLPQALSNFFMRLEIPFPEKDALAVIIVTLDGGPLKPQIMPLILDIDVVRDVKFSDDLEVIWGDLEVLRDIKNECFFKALTPKAKGALQMKLVEATFKLKGNILQRDLDQSLR